MFNREYSFWGTHAQKVEMLTSPIGDNDVFALFNRNVDVYMVAPIVGFLYNNKAELDKKDNMEKKIALSQMSPNIKELEYNYRLIMLLDKEYTPDVTQRIDKAFRHYNTDNAADDELRYESYVRGGIDVLYDKIYGNANNDTECINNLQDFLEEYNDRYNSIVSENDDLASLVRS